MTLRQRMARVTGGAPALPLVVLFGLNATDELDRAAFGVLLPEIRDEFGLDLRGVLGIVSLVALVALAAQVPVAAIADRHHRVRLAGLGALGWAVFSVLTGAATTLVMLGVARAGSGVGRAVVDPTHNSLLADYYDLDARPRVYAVHRAANALGAFAGPIAAGLIAAAFGWRVPFLVFAVPTVVCVVVALRLSEPSRGLHERRAAGAAAGALHVEEPPPSFAEAWRIVWKIETLRRVWMALPFLAASLIGFVSLAALAYDDAFGLDERARGFAAAAVEPAQLIGLVIGARLARRRTGGATLTALGGVAWAVAVALAGFAVAPNLAVAIGCNAVVTALLAMLAPGILTTLASAIPPRARAMGFAVASLWVIPGLLVLPLVGWIGDRTDVRLGILLLAPMFIIGGAVLARAGATVDRDVHDVRLAATMRAADAQARRTGLAPRLAVRALDAGYDGRQALFGVDLQVGAGECVALLGTNGAGKSTLLRAIGGVLEADRGVVLLDGREITHAPPHEISALGVAHVPGGAGVFATLTVRENLRAACWLTRRRRRAVTARMDAAFDLFPALRARAGDPAGDLSGGQQQMLALAMALGGRPKVLLIDELSLGLAPAVVAELIPVIRRAQQQGTTVVLVEQSVQVALQVAETAVFLERGEVRYRGPTADLLERPDLLRSVFLGTAPAARAAARDGDEGTPNTAGRIVARDRTPAGREPVLSCVGLGVSFGGIRAVDDVSFALAPGERLGLIGANGAGKTTLFDLLSGHTRADRGRVVLGGTDITRTGAAVRGARGLGRSFQDARLFPSMTVTETVAVAADRWIDVRDPMSAALRLPNAYAAELRTRQRVHELIELLGLGAVRSRFVRELSTGTRRVVDLACVLAHRPRVVLLDEPSAGLAQREVEALGPLLQTVSAETGAAMVVIEHDMNLLAAVAARWLALDGGRVLLDGPAADVQRDARVVAAYLGTTAATIERSNRAAGAPTPETVH